MRALTQKIEIEVGKNRRKTIRVFKFDDPVAESDAQPIGAGIVRTPAGEQSRRHECARADNLRRVTYSGDLPCAGEKDANDRAPSST